MSTETLEMECRNQRMESEEQLAEHQAALAAQQVATRAAEQLAAKVSDRYSNSNSRETNFESIFFEAE